MADASLSVFAPAKINLFLAVTGRRADGFHDLLSVVATLDLGDTLEAAPAAEFSLTCDDPLLPCDESNLVLKAARAFARVTAWGGAAAFKLTKRIPVGAGLGGGSSDGAAALLALNELVGRKHALSPEVLAKLAAEIGSDCPLFLARPPAVIRGRGERVSVLSDQAACRLRGREVLVFKPAFGIATPWAYGQLAARAPASYLPSAAAEAKLQRWLENPTAPAEALVFNNMEPLVFSKYLALSTLLATLQDRFGIAARVSGSGSACFALLEDGFDATQLEAVVREAWGDSAFVAKARLT